MIHCGTNNLDSESTPVEIVNDITDLGNAVKMKKKTKKKQTNLLFSDLSTQRSF